MHPNANGASQGDRAGSAVGGLASLGRRVLGRWVVALAIGMTLTAGSASGHSGVILLPPAGDYLIRWYQPHGVRPVDNWQIEVARHRSSGAPTIVNARMSSDASCWALQVPVNRPAIARVRSAAGAQVSAWSLATRVPNAEGYLIRWYQSRIRPVDDWDIEVTPVQNPAAPFVATALVMPDPGCWALTVPVAESANVRIRSVVGSQVSAWSPRTSVPEVGLGAGTLSAACLLAGLARRRQRRAAPKGR